MVDNGSFRWEQDDKVDRTKNGDPEAIISMEERAGECPSKLHIGLARAAKKLIHTPSPPRWFRCRTRSGLGMKCDEASDGVLGKLGHY